ncbi:helix-turn-helix domain-containing protein [Streptomyces sp. NPDC094472]|uniref:helix-turn-helix domain-containing protein n=1 Tax=unclassified Streptomyces TaxID=2593676 RepID=UPI00332C3BEF
MALDLAASLIAHHLGGDRVLPPETHQQTPIIRIHAFIHRHLGDPRLGPDLIAAAHHIPSRSLHRLFQSQGTAFIRHHRLERARRDLADPRRVTRPTHATAARRGFDRPADFTRAFRTTYGLPRANTATWPRTTGLAHHAEQLTLTANDVSTVPG